MSLEERDLRAWGIGQVLTGASLIAGGLQSAIHPLGALAVPAIALAVAGLSRRKGLELGTSHGSAEWGTPEEVLPARDGLIVGQDAEGGFMFAPSEGHLLTVAPTGAGKGVGAVLPNLLWYPGSVIVTDPKGENYAVTGQQRRVWGPVLTLDPFGVTGAPTAAFNPIARIGRFIVRGEIGAAYEYATLLATSLVVPRESGESFWDEEATALLGGLILAAGQTAAAGGKGSLVLVRRWLNLDLEGWDALMKQMQSSSIEQVAAAANRFEAAESRVRSSIKSTAQSHTHLLDSPQIQQTLERSTFEPGELQRAPATLYLVLPPDKLGSYGRWLRLVVGSLLHEMVSGVQEGGRRVMARPEHDVVFLLDEFAQLGRVRSVEQAISLIRGYGVRLWMLVQDLSQLRGLYGQRWETLVANVQVLQAFGTNDPGTAEYLSKRLGQGTIRIETMNTSQGASTSPGRWGSSSSRGKTVGEQAFGRPLLYPDEVARLGREEQLIVCPGAKPLRVARLSYLENPFLLARADSNPYHAGGGKR